MVSSYFFKLLQKKTQWVPDITSKCFKNNIHRFFQMSSNTRHCGIRVSEILSNFFKNKTQWDPEILSNRFKNNIQEDPWGSFKFYFKNNAQKNPQDSLKFLKIQDFTVHVIPRLFQTNYFKIKHKWSTSLFQIVLKMLYRKIPEILSNYFRNQTQR